MKKILLASVVLLAVVANSGAAAPPLLAIDADHPLATEAAIDRFEEDGVVSRNLSEVDLGITVAKKAGQADIGGHHADLTQTYLCLEYREGLDREIRVYLPESYFEPRPAELSPMGEQGGPTATLSPVENGTMTAVTVTFTEPARPCYVIHMETGVYFGVRSWMAEVTENATGVQLPDLRGKSADWDPIQPRELAGNATVPLPEAYTEPAVQYNTADDGEDRWVNVPECTDPTEQRVCRFERNNQTHVMSTSENPPAVRYRERTSPSITFESAINDALAAVDRIQDSIDDLFGGTDA